MITADLGNESIVQLLIDKGADVNMKNKKGDTALYLAVVHGHEEFLRTKCTELIHETNIFSNYGKIVCALLQVGAIVNESNWNTATAHLMSTELVEPSTYILKMLLAAGAELEHEFLVSKERLQDLTIKCIREHLKKNHPDKNLCCTIPQLGLSHQMRSYLLFHTLHRAKIEHKFDEEKYCEGNVHRLIHGDVDVNASDENGMTHLMKVCHYGKEKLVEALVKAGAKINQQDSMGNTALIFATHKKQNHCMQKLLQFGADINIQGEDGFTALMHSARFEDVSYLKAMIQNGANPNLQAHNGMTALAVAASTGSISCVDLLISTGTDVNLASMEGVTALVYAARNGDRECIRKLIAAGADINNDKRGRKITPLMAAAQIGHVHFIKELIQAGADLNIQNKNGATALVLANFHGSDRAVKTLIEAGAEIKTSLGLFADIARELLLLSDARGIKLSRLWS